MVSSKLPELHATVVLEQLKTSKQHMSLALRTGGKPTYFRSFPTNLDQPNEARLQNQLQTLKYRLKSLAYRFDNALDLPSMRRRILTMT